jgi:hypothetical protein
MAKQTITHQAPNNSPEHLALRNAALQSGANATLLAQLRELLWLLNMDDKLTAFLIVCRNLASILDDIENLWGLYVEGENLAWIRTVVIWADTHKTLLLKLVGPEIDPAITNNQENPMMSNDSGRHPLHTLLCCTAHDHQLRKKYHLLQGHLLLSHIKALRHGSTLAGYEKYSGKDRWEGIPGSCYSAALAAREFSQASNTDILKSLPTEQFPRDFIKSFETVKLLDLKMLLYRRTSILNFLKLGLGITAARNKSNPNPAPRHVRDNVKRPSIPGFVELNDCLVSVETITGEDNDENFKWGTQTVITENNIVEDKRDELLDDDICPDELDSDELYLTDLGGESGSFDSGNLAGAAQTQIGHIRMAYQMFPWAYSNLAVNEVASLLLHARLTLKLDQPLTQLTEVDLKQAEIVTLLQIMLWTGSTLERAKTLNVVAQGMTATADFSLEYSTQAVGSQSTQNDSWRIIALKPTYLTDKDDLPRSGRQRLDFMNLPDAAGAAKFVRRLLELRALFAQQTETNSQQPIAPDPDIDSVYVFPRHVETYRKELRKLLAEIDPSGRITESKIQNFLFQLIVQHSKGNVTDACIISAVHHPLSRVRLFYSTPQIAKLQQTYVTAVSKVINQIDRHPASDSVSQLLPVYADKSLYVGSRLCPTYDAVKDAITSLKDEINNPFNPVSISAFIRHHNLFTLYAVWHFGFATACRAISTPYLYLTEIDQKSGLGCLADKDDGSGYKSRLIYLAQPTIEQMQRYESHLATLRAQVPSNAVMTAPCYFFQGKDPAVKAPIDEDPAFYAPIEVRPKTLQPIMKEFLDYPANFHRRFLRNELLERGCPVEVVDAFMGHWKAGEEPWAVHSSFSFASYCVELNKYLIPFLKDLGLVPVKSSLLL